MKGSVSSLESSCFSKYSGAPQGHHVIFHAKGPPLPPPPYISLLYIIYHISLLHPRWDEQCRDTMMTVPPQLTSSLPSFSYPASFRHPPPASSGSPFSFLSVAEWLTPMICWETSLFAHQNPHVSFQLSLLKSPFWVCVQPSIPPNFHPSDWFNGILRPQITGKPYIWW